MSDHDPLCPFSDTFGAPCMYCALITRVRADERQVVADLRAKVEALRDIDPHYQPVRDAYDAVLALIDGGSDG